MNNPNIAVPHDSVTIENLQELSRRASAIMSELRQRMLLPTAAKTPPMVSTEIIASTCGLKNDQILYRIRTNPEVPQGSLTPNGRRREYTVKEAQTWSRLERGDYLRPEGKRAVTVGVAFFKGGVTKTTTTMSLAQGLSLLGHKVLCIDMDPQGSLTTLFGLLPDSEINEEDTLGPLFSGEAEDVKYAIRHSYWPNVDLIPASSSLFAAEFHLPSQQVKNSEFQFWNVLNQGLESVRDYYDIILIDTPPSLSYMTINAFFAADGMIVPMTASMLDMASSAQFWNLFSDFAYSISSKLETPKKYDFINILMAKINNNDATTRPIREWISTVYGGKLMPVEIPLTAVTTSAASEFSTVFDISNYDGDARTYKRAREAYESLALAVEQSIRSVWAKDEVQK
jgi:chromosome partitioning protein